jgi:SOS-response transcriptional repressor LexA
MDQHRKRRLAHLIKSRYNDSQAELARDAKLTEGRITQLLDPDQPFGERAARSLVERLRLDDDRYFEREDVSNVEEAPDIRAGVPLISWIQAGTWAEASDPLQPGDAEAWVPSLRPTSARAFALRVRGDSMTAPYGKSFPEGCIIIVEPERRSPVNGDRIVARLEGSNEVTFKIYKEEDGQRWLQPLNPSHLPIREPFKVLGTVVGIWMDG